MHWPEFVNELSLGHNYLKRQWVLTVGGAAEIAALKTIAPFAEFKILLQVLQGLLILRTFSGSCTIIYMHTIDSCQFPMFSDVKRQLSKRERSKPASNKTDDKRRYHAEGRRANRGLYCS